MTSEIVVQGTTGSAIAADINWYNTAASFSNIWNARDLYRLIDLYCHSSSVFDNANTSINVDTTPKTLDVGSIFRPEEVITAFPTMYTCTVFNTDDWNYSSRHTHVVVPPVDVHVCKFALACCVCLVYREQLVWDLSFQQRLKTIVVPVSELDVYLVLEHVFPSNALPVCRGTAVLFVPDISCSILWSAEWEVLSSWMGKVFWIQFNDHESIVWIVRGPFSQESCFLGPINTKAALGMHEEKKWRYVGDENRLGDRSLYNSRTLILCVLPPLFPIN